MLESYSTLINNETIIEYCTDDLRQAVLAEKAGATRIEFCADLIQDGLSPKIETVQKLRKNTQIPIRTMIRPSNSFKMDVKNENIFFYELKAFQNIGLNEFVFGYLNDKLMPDVDFLNKLSDVAGSSKFTFHKAIDSSSDILKAINILENYDFIDCILSSGGQETAFAGIEILKDMQKFSSKTIIAAGKLTFNNLNLFADKSSLHAFHGRNIIRI